MYVNKGENMDSVIQMVLDGNWTDMTKYTEKRAANKISARINEKKKEIIAKFNTDYDSSTDDK